MKRFILATLAASLLSGCAQGQWDRQMATWTGQPAKTCVDGVLYLQFTSGAAVAYTADGRVRTCK